MERYSRSNKWIHLSRDLLGLPRRLLMDFEPGKEPSYPYGQTLPTVVGWSLLGAVALTTTALAWRHRRDPAPLEGPAAAFVLLGAWLTCLHFMFYDVLLAALPVGLLFTDPSRYLPLRQNTAPPGQGRWVRNLLPLLLLILLLSVPSLICWFDEHQWGQPVDTLLLAWLWAWCGCAWVRADSAPPA